MADLDSTSFRRSGARFRASGLALDLPLVALVVAARLASALEPCDDAFIVLAVVRNALGGFGPHLDPGSADAVLSTFLWPLLLGAGTAAGLEPLAALARLGGLADIALALAVRRLAGEAVASPLTGAIVAAMLVTHPVLLLATHAGMETGLVLALVAWGGLGLLRGRISWVAAAVALLPWARVDGAVAAAVLVACACTKWLAPGGSAPGGSPGEERRAAAGTCTKWLAPALAMGGAAFLAHRIVYGVWLPASVTAKAAAGGGGFSLAGAAATAGEFAKAAIGQSAYWLTEPSAHLLALPLALFGAWNFFRDKELRNRLAPVLGWAGVYVGLFVAVGRGYAINFPWYFAPPLLALMLLAGAGLAPGLRRFEARADRFTKWLAPVGAVVGVAALVAPGVLEGQRGVRARFTAHRERAYAAAALWLGRHGPAGSVASNEVGALAWFSPPGTRIVDLFGLSRAPEEIGLPATELVALRRPAAVVTRIDFPYRRALAAASPAARVWVQAGSLDLGLDPDLAARLEPHQLDLQRTWRELPSLWRAGRVRQADSIGGIADPVR